MIPAEGGLLLPGLHDHHIHFRAYARSLDSIDCGPPAVNNRAELAALLREQDINATSDWIRGVGYHESVAGEIDRAWLDTFVTRHPIRIQHRSGRLWIMNSRAVGILVSRASAQDRQLEGSTEGRFFDQDNTLGLLIGHQESDVRRASRQLAALGITGFTDMTPSNDTHTMADFAAWQTSGHLLQRVRVAGGPSLSAATRSGGLCIGETKFHLHDHALPTFEDYTARIRRSHADGRAIAVHCVTELALVYTIAALRETGVIPGDRIEHAALTPPALLPALRELGLLVVTQPHFITQRGDQYRTDVPEEEHDWLYRCASFTAHAVNLAAGSDAPFGSPDPWAAMHSAISRRTASGEILGASEALVPEAALDLFLGSLASPASARQIAVGSAADLCLLDRPWSRFRQSLILPVSVTSGAAALRATLCGGRLIHDRVDQSPG